MFCRIASFFCFSIYNRHHFLNEGGEVMKSKKVRSILNSSGIHTTLRNVPEYCGIILSKVFHVPLEQIMENLETEETIKDVVGEFSSLLEQYMLVFYCDYPEYESKSTEDGKTILTINMSSHFLKKGIIKDVDAALIKMHFAGGKTQPEEFLDKSHMDESDESSKYSFISYSFDMDYLLHCDIDIIKNPESLEYYFYPFVCYDRNVLNDIYKDDSVMQKAVEYIQKLFPDPYIDTY